MHLLFCAQQCSEHAEAADLSQGSSVCYRDTQRGQAFRFTQILVRTGTTHQDGQEVDGDQLVAHVGAFLRHAYRQTMNQNNCTRRSFTTHTLAIQTTRIEHKKRALLVYNKKTTPVPCGQRSRCPASQSPSNLAPRAVEASVAATIPGDVSELRDQLRGACRVRKHKLGMHDYWATWHLFGPPTPKEPCTTSQRVVTQCEPTPTVKCRMARTRLSTGVSCARAECLPKNKINKKYSCDCSAALLPDITEL